MALLLIVGGCAKDDVLSDILSSQITVGTQTVTSIGQNTAFSGVLVTGGFSEDVLEKGICWGTGSNPTTVQSKVSAGTGSGQANLSLTGLIPGTTYYVRGYVTTAQETIYGEQRQFSTVGYQLAAVSTSPVGSLTLNTAVSGGNVTAQGGGTVTARGVCWSTFSGPTVSNSRTTDGSGLGAYVSNLFGLTAGTTYYLRAYATNQAGTVYGSQISFTTTGYALANLSTAIINTISQTSAYATTSVVTDGGGLISTKGVCWSIFSGPTTSNNRTIDGSGSGTYSSSLTGLSPNTTYYVRAYATNQAGTAYGPQSTFTTLAIQLATVAGGNVSSITRNTANLSATITSDGGGSVTSRGVCYSIGTNPTVPSSAYSLNGSGTGSFSVSLTGLLTATTYYARAFAINAAGISYGPLLSFRTL